jgi:GNAT superfamily N-acetyltransferase
MKIRPAIPGDRAFVLEAAQRLASFDPPSWRSEQEIVEGERRTLAAFFAAPPPGASLLIAESDDGQGLGFVYLERLQDYFTLDAHGHVGILVVTETAAGHGVGGALMRAAEAWARDEGYGKLTLNVFEANRAARAVYDHLGYAPETLRYVKVLGRLKSFVEKGTPTP